MKENKTKIILLLLLVGAALLLNFCDNRNSSKKSQEGEFHVSEEPIPEAEIHEWNENRISNMQDKPEDNLPSEEKKERKKEKWKCNLKDMKSIRKNSHGYEKKTGSVSKKK